MGEPRRGLVFVTERIDPPRAGYHRRTLALIDALTELGFGIVVAGLTRTGERPLGPDTGAAVLPTEARTAPRAEPSTWLEHQLVRVASKIDPREADLVHNRPSLRRWFRDVVRAERPDLIVMSYGRWSRLLPPKLRATTMCDVNDLLSVNQRLRDRLQRDLAAALSTGEFDAVTDPTYFEGMDLHPSRSELRAFERFDVTMSITAHEAEMIEAGTRHTEVITVPATAETVDAPAAGDGPAVYVGGANPFNVQGHLFFVHRVLAGLRTQVPDFRLDVVGEVGVGLPAPAEVRTRGYEADIRDVYGRARFAICPLLGGTGEKVKIVDAMAHGRPVVAVAASAHGSPLIDGETGFIARDGAEFAERCASLWIDEDLRVRMGRRAKEVVARTRSRARMTGALADALSHVARPPFQRDDEVRR